MKALRIMLPALTVLFVSTLVGPWFSAAVAQEDMREVRSGAFTTHTRPAAVFMHDTHNEKAGLDDCAECHHGKDAQGRRDREDVSAGTPCSECHAMDAGGKETPLRRAYHQQCIGCHKGRNAGPTHCGGCHVSGGS